VNPPQINIGGHLAIGQGPIEMFRPRLRHRQVANGTTIEATVPVTLTSPESEAK